MTCPHSLAVVTSTSSQRRDIVDHRVCCSGLQPAVASVGRIVASGSVGQTSCSAVCFSFRSSTGLVIVDLSPVLTFRTKAPLLGADQRASTCPTGPSTIPAATQAARALEDVLEAPAPQRLLIRFIVE